LSSGQMIEAAMVGRDSMLGATAALDGQVSLNKAIVQLPGHSEVLNVAKFRQVADQSPALRTTLLRHEQVVFAQAQQSAACNAAHTVEPERFLNLLLALDQPGSTGGTEDKQEGSEEVRGPPVEKSVRQQSSD
jgi:hypothetical protein